MILTAPNKNLMIGIAVLAIALTAACNSKPDTTYTLYRNSPLGRSDRVHFATFNAAESNDFNRSNCSMSARLLNANFAASAKAEGKDPIAGIGFWCEPGSYSAKGQVPSSFDASFPASSDGPLSW